MKFPPLSSWVEPRFFRERERWWCWWSEKCLALVRLEPCLRLNRPSPLLSNKNCKSWPPTLVSSDFTLPLWSSRCCCLDSLSLRASSRSGRLVPVSLKYWISSSSVSSLWWWPFLKDFPCPSLSHWPSQSRRCLMIRIWSERWKPVRLWVEPTTFARTRLELWPWTRWLSPKSGTDNLNRWIFTRKNWRRVTCQQTSNTMSCSRLPPWSTALLSSSPRRKDHRPKSLFWSTSREWASTVRNTRASSK